MSGEEPSAFDAVPLRRATPDGPDRADQPAGGQPVHAEPAPDQPASDPAPSDPTTSGEPVAAQAASSPAPSSPVTSGEPVAAQVQRHRTPVGRGMRALRRLPPPHRVPAIAARGIAGWARRPGGRLALAGLFIAVLLGLTGAAGAYLVPASAPLDTRPAAQDANAPSDSPSATGAPTTVPSAGPALPPSAIPGTSSGTGAPIGVAGARPADALSGWAQQIAGRVDVPLVALQAYGYAELVVAETTPGCQLSWTTLAAIGKVESNHGSHAGSTLYPDGQALPAIIGDALDGKDGRAAIADTDGGQLDRDTQWDRAVGPMQFIPSTWRSQAVDADNDAIRNPNDIDDAALAAANYLCSGGRDLATPAGWWDAIAAYNIPRSYGRQVFAAANEYGTLSRG